MFQITPLTKPEINWNDYLNVTQLALGFSVVEDMLRKKQSVNNVAGFYKSLETIINLPAKHIHYSFLVTANKDFFFRLMEHQSWLDISISDTKNPDYYIAVVSSHLHGWKTALLEMSDGDEDSTIRRFANEILQFFECTENLKQAFLDVYKNKMPDGTIKLLTR